MPMAVMPQSSGSQGGAAASASPGSLLETHTLSSYPKSPESEVLKVEPNQPSRWFLVPLCQSNEEEGP